MVRLGSNTIRKIYYRWWYILKLILLYNKKYMAKKIVKLLYRTDVKGRVPAASNLQFGELALNYSDGKIFYKNADGTVQAISAEVGGTFGTLSGQSLTSKLINTSAFNLAYGKITYTDASDNALFTIGRGGTSDMTFTQLGISWSRFALKTKLVFLASDKDTEITPADSVSIVNTGGKIRMGFGTTDPQHSAHFALHNGIRFEPFIGSWYEAIRQNSTGTYCYFQYNNSFNSVHTYTLQNNGYLTFGSYYENIGYFGCRNTTGENRFDYALFVKPSQSLWTFDGHLKVTGNVTASNVSDIRLKKNINRNEKWLDVVKNIDAVSFDWTDDAINKNGTCEPIKQYGFIAQEVESILPSVVSKNKDGYKMINYTQLISVAFGAIKELSKKVEELTSEINKLKGL